MNPGAETAYIDEITEEMCNVNIDDYDFADAQQVARYNANCKRAVAKKELVDQRTKMHAALCKRFLRQGSTQFSGLRDQNLYHEQ